VYRENIEFARAITMSTSAIIYEIEHLELVALELECSAIVDESAAILLRIVRLRLNYWRQYLAAL
jgi:hypothetical protein